MRGHVFPRTSGSEPTFWFTAPVGIPSYHSCIQLAAHMWEKYGGYHWQVEWTHITPDLADDELSKTAEVVYTSLVTTEKF